jgi:hypothetical protein
LKEALQHIISYSSEGHLLGGGKKYRLLLPSGIPASDFWSIIVYNSLSRLIIQTDQPWPSVFSSNKKLAYLSDGSLEAWFGPEPVNENTSNWVKTIPGEHWYLVLRLYYPLEPWYNKCWQPGEIVELK